MPFIRRLILVTAALLIVAAAFAQMSDQQLIEELKRYSTSGLSQEKILTELASKGVTREQLERIKAQYDASKATETVTEVTQDSRARVLSAQRPDQVIVVKEAVNTGTGEVFGRDLFSSKNLTFQPILNLPTPENYQLGAGDEIIIDIWGNSELNFKQKISPDGSIQVQNIGPIFLNGLLVKDATVKIKRAYSRIFSDLASPTPKTFIRVTLGNIRSIQVNIMGEVALPGTYTLSSFATVFHALYSAGGINDIGSLRDIKVYRNSKVMAQVDVYDYLLNGDDSKEIVLKEGDLVKVDPYKKRVQITGAVKRPMWYELKESETVKTLIDYSGGFKSNAYKENVRITRKGATELKFFMVESTDFNNFILDDGDSLTIDIILDRYENKVEITGSVFRPGDYAIDSNVNTLKKLITIALGPKEDAFLARSLLYRENSDLTTRVESVDLSKLLKGEIADIELKKNDKLYIPSINELKTDFTVTLSGEVKRPGSFPYVHNMVIEELILQAGGLLESASSARIDVSRIIKDPMSISESEIKSQTYSFSLEKGLIISGDKNFVLKPFDDVVVRKSPSYETQQNITITGEVLFGGSYPKITQNERLSSFVKRAGGLKSTAYINGATLTRIMSAEENVAAEASLRLSNKSIKDSILIDNIDASATYKVSIELEKALEKPGSDYDVVLKEGDLLAIPNLNSIVKISGAVMYPNAMTYIAGMSIKSYINNSGGYSFGARKNKVFVVYMNGRVSKGLSSKIEPGCEIIVPVKPQGKPKLTTGEIMGITTSLVSIMSMIMLITK